MLRALAEQKEAVKLLQKHLELFVLNGMTAGEILTGEKENENA